MRLIIRLDPNRPRHWHLRLVQRLADAMQIPIALEWSGEAAPLPLAVTLMAAVEKLIYRLPGTYQFAPVRVEDFAPFARRDAGRPDDIVLDLAGSGSRSYERTWQLRFDGRRDEAAAIGALIRSRTPVVSIVDAASGSEIVSGHPGLENSRVLACAFDDVMARAASLVKAALEGATPRHTGERPAPARADLAAMAWFVFKSISFELLSAR
jgi:hypothetical protein